MSVALAAPVSVLQGALFVTSETPMIYSFAAIVLAVATLLLAAGYFAPKNLRLWPLPFLLVAQFALFAVKLIGAEPPLSLRVLHVAVVAAYIATTVLALLGGIRIVGPIRAIWFSYSVAGAFFVTEVMLEFSAQAVPQMHGSGSPLIAAMAPHARLGAVNVSNTTVNALYRGDPQEQFQKIDPRQNRWLLRVGGGGVARLKFPADEPHTIRIAITKAADRESYDIQLRQPGLPVRLDSRYTLRFRARSDRPRSIFVGAVMADDPWAGLGLYSEVMLTPEWRTFEETFVPLADDDNAQIVFDVGHDDTSLEVSDVVLRRLPAGTVVEPDLAPKTYAVSYRFNSLGCRGPDYAIPRPNGTSRLLLLGNSYTLGAGVREEATYAYQLERLLNARGEMSDSRERYEVINCGAGGYGTGEERLFYQLRGAKYEPTLVVVGMTWSDDISFWEAKRRGYVRRSPGRLESVFRTWAAIGGYRYRRPLPDYSESVKEILQLDHEVRKHGGRLVVFIFRNNADYSGSTDSGRTWNRLTQAVKQGVEAAKIPLLDLGGVLAQGQSDEDLKAHSVVGFDPNETAHAIAARELLSFLEREDLLGP